MGRAILVAGCILATGCALAVSTSEYAGGTRDPDGGTPTTMPPEAGTTPANEAGTDAGAHFCAGLSPQPAFCEDFDEGPLDLTRWSDVEREDDQSSFKLDGTNTTSAPNALLVGVTKGGNQFPAAWLRENVGDVPKIRVECDVRVDQFDSPTGGTRLVGIQAGGGDNIGAGAIVQFGVYAGGMGSVNEEWDPNGTPQHFDHGQKPITFGTWLHVIVRADLDAKTLSVNVDGTEYSDGVAIHGPIAKGPVSGIIGLYYPETDVQGWSVRYDNIVINGQ